MSWGYWGIVGGMLALLTVFFISLGILHRSPSSTLPDQAQSRDEKGRETSSDKHAA
ncbi:MAG: hypothetical protein ACREI3_10245 [Nitrospirales bacterium]